MSLLNSLVRPRLLVMVCACLAGPVYGQRVIVYGERLAEEPEPGRMEWVPQTATEHDAAQRLRFQPSLQPQESQAVRASGFAVPRVRGHDPAMVSAFLDDIPLQDSYTGLPVIYDFDLRASGAMNFYQGLSPLYLPVVNGVGTIHFRLADVGKPQRTFGLSVGNPYGLGPWLRIDQQHQTTTERQWQGRLFARHHATQGRFRYFDHGGTPHQHDDDAMRWRENNDQRSWQVLPVIQTEHGRDTWRLLGWHLQKDAGLPTASQRLASAARQNLAASFADLAWTRRGAGPFASDLTLAAHHRRDEVGLDDPQRRFFSLSTQSKLRVAASHLRLTLAGEGMRRSWRYQLKPHQSRVAFRSAEARIIGLAHQGFDQYAALRHDFDSGWYGEVQLDYRWASGQRRTSDAGARMEATSGAWLQQHRGVGSELGIEFEHGHRLYLRLAAVARAPSLFEVFGDGATVQGSEQLRPEQLRHSELGGVYQLRSGLALSLLAYHDRVEDKIVLIPASLGEALRAANIRDTQTSGQELSLQWQGTPWSLRLGWSHLDARNLTRRGEQRQIPGVSRHVAVSDLVWSSRHWQLRWMSRYRDLLYQDLGNRQALPASWVHDLNLDWSQGSRHSSALADASLPGWQLGLAVLNLADATRLRLPTDANGVRGYAPYSEIRGAPLPGRQWQAHVVRRF